MIRLNDVLRHARAGVLLILIQAVAFESFAAAAQDPQVGGGASAVSPERISEGLRRPELQIPPVPLETPTFRVDITGTLETPLDVVRRELRAEAGLPPWRGGSGHVTQGIDILPALMGLVSKFKTIRREHAEAEARQMVRRELAAFCATHDCSQVVQEPLTEGGVLVPR